MTRLPAVLRSTWVAVALVGTGALPARAAQSVAQPSALVVRLSGLGFMPATLTVHPGDRVTWLNDDLIVHTVTGADRSFDSGDLPGGKSWTYIARQKGTFLYACRYHPNMTGTLVVQ